MRKPSAFKSISLSLLLLVPLISHAGGGWVGNSPITVASVPTAIYQPLYSSGPEAPEKKWNSLLLPDGKSRFSISARKRGFEAGESDSLFHLGLGYDHAFSENWTTFSFLTWGYNLLAGNGKGSEVALYFGLLDGIGYSSYNGLLLGPGAGLGYSYSTDNWRFTTNFSASGLYGSERGKFQYAKLRLGADIQYFVSENWSVGLESGVRYYPQIERFDEDCEYRGCYRRGDHAYIEEVMAYATRKVTKNSEVSLGVGTGQNASLGYSISW